MEQTNPNTGEPTIEEHPAENRSESKELLWEEIDVEEVAIDGICGVY